MSAKVIVNVNDQLLAHPAIRQLVDDMTELFKLEIVQSVRDAPVRSGVRSAHAPDSAGASKVGALVANRLQRLPAAKLEAAKAALALTPALRRSAQRLGVVTDARTTLARRPALRQASLAPQLGAVERSLRGGLLQSLLNSPTGTAGGAVANQGVRFLIQELICVKETNEIGKDEILLGGVAVDADETTTIIPNSQMGKFKTGDRRTFSPPKELAAFGLAGEFPKSFAVFVALAEEDLGGFSTFLTELYEGIKTEVTTVLATVGAAIGVVVGSKIGAKLGAEVGAVIGGPIGIVIGAVAGAILGALVAWLINAAKDDIFVPQVAALALPSADADFGATGTSSGPLTLTFTDFGGTYQLRYNWELRR